MNRTEKASANKLNISVGHASSRRRRLSVTVSHQNKKKKSMPKENYIFEIKQEFPSIMLHEDDDNWWDEGIKFLKNQDFEEAEIKFKMLTQSQPNHHDGFEGLAYLYYEIGERKKSIWFMEKALKIARRFLEDDSIDIQIIEDMEFNLKSIKNKKKIRKWWA